MSHDEYDLFISHASEDKKSFVAPLSRALSAFGVRLWYDEFSLKLGDSLSRSIDKGLANSTFGLVVLSPAFFAKNWPEYELRGLTAREMQGKKVILPIWHNVTHDQVVTFSPPLADKLAIKSTSGSPTKIAVEIIEAIRPDILAKIHLRIAFRLAKGQKKTIKRSELRLPPIRHESLPDELVGRIRLVRAALLGVYTHSMEFWINGFQRDLHPSTEVAIWEHTAAVYLEYVRMTRLKPTQHPLVFKLILAVQAEKSESEVSELAARLPEDAFEVIRNLWMHNVPVYDVEEKLPSFLSKADGTDREDLEALANMDAETFPKDLPEDFIRELVDEIKAEKPENS